MGWPIYRIPEFAASPPEGLTAWDAVALSRRRINGMRHHHELELRVEWQGGHVDGAFDDVLDIHAPLGLDPDRTLQASACGVRIYARPGLRRSGVNGARRRRTPVASKTALASAPATGRIELSPAPAGGNSGRLSSTMSTVSGASVMSRIG